MWQIQTRSWQLGFALALLGSVLWGLTPAATKLALEATDADVLAFLRLAIAAVVFRFFGRTPVSTILHNPWAWVAGIALGGDFLLYTRGLERTMASSAALLVCVEPVATILLAVWLLGERWNIHRAVGSTLTLAGVLFAGLHGVTARDGEVPATLAGNALIATAAVLWSIFAVAQRKTLTDHDWASRLQAIFLVAACVTLPCAATAPRVDWQASTVAWAALFVLVLFCTAGVYAVYAHAQRLVDVSVLSLLLAGIPVFSLLFAQLLLPEPFSLALLVGSLFVFAGSLTLALEPTAAVRQAHGALGKRVEPPPAG